MRSITGRSSTNAMMHIGPPHVHERHGAEAGAHWRAGAALADRRLDRAQEDREQAADHLGVANC